jgi:hypothetical protein
VTDWITASARSLGNGSQRPGSPADYSCDLRLWLASYLRIPGQGNDYR